jgi:hypothetical protein
MEGGGRGGMLSKRAKEAEGTLRSSGDPVRRWRRSSRRAACWKCWEDDDEVAGISFPEKGAAGAGGGEGGGVAGIVNMTAVNVEEGME